MSTCSDWRKSLPKGRIRKSLQPAWGRRIGVRYKVVPDGSTTWVGNGTRQTRLNPTALRRQGTALAAVRARHASVGAGAQHVARSGLCDTPLRCNVPRYMPFPHSSPRYVSLPPHSAACSIAERPKLRATIPATRTRRVQVSRTEDVLATVPNTDFTKPVIGHHVSRE